MKANSEGPDPTHADPQTPTELLLQHKDRFRLLIESATDYAIFFLDVEGLVADWNSGAERITGYTEEEIVGQPSAIIFTAEDRQKGAPERELNTAKTEGRAVNERWHVRKDGSLFWGSGIVSPLYDDDAAFIGFSKVMRDHTERKQAEQRQEELLRREQEAKHEAEAARKEAEAANQAKDQFIAMVAHELRTPLGIVSGWVDILQAQDIDVEMQQRALGAIKRSTNSQRQLINDLLDVSRINSGKLSLDVTEVDMMLLITAAIENARPAVEARSLQLQAFCASDVATMCGDAERLQQIVSNLINNSIKFTPPGGRIEVHLHRDGTSHLIRVVDTGIGIGVELLPQIFERYRQGHPTQARRQGGLGLGLSIVKQLVEMHGGTIKAESDGEGQGASFTVQLPMQYLSA